MAGRSRTLVEPYKEQVRALYGSTLDDWCHAMLREPAGPAPPQGEEMPGG